MKRKRKPKSEARPKSERRLHQAPADVLALFNPFEDPESKNPSALRSCTFTADQPSTVGQVELMTFQGRTLFFLHTLTKIASGAHKDVAQSFVFVNSLWYPICRLMPNSRDSINELLEKDRLDLLSKSLQYPVLPCGQGDSFVCALGEGVDSQAMSFNDCLTLLHDLLSFLESNNIVHRDIKLDNIVFLEGRYCLIDFAEADALPIENIYIYRTTYTATDVVELADYINDYLSTVDIDELCQKYAKGDHIESGAAGYYFSRFIDDLQSFDSKANTVTFATTAVMRVIFHDEAAVDNLYDQGRIDLREFKKQYQANFKRAVRVGYLSRYKGPCKHNDDFALASLLDDILNTSGQLQPKEKEVLQEMIVAMSHPDYSKRISREDLLARLASNGQQPQATI